MTVPIGKKNKQGNQIKTKEIVSKRGCRKHQSFDVMKFTRFFSKTKYSTSVDILLDAKKKSKNDDITKTSLKEKEAFNI